VEFSKDERRIDCNSYCFSQLDFFLDISQGVAPFWKNKVRKNQIQIEIAFSVTLKYSDPNEVTSENKDFTR